MTSGGATRRILVTGASGEVGRATLRRFAEGVAGTGDGRDAGVRVRAFVHDNAAASAALARLPAGPHIEPFLGDLTRGEDVARAVRDVDVVLHLGAVVSPLADDHPGLAWRVNVGSMQRIVDAVRALPDPGRVAVVGIGSVAEFGHRPPPVHWGRVGDPVRASTFDEYAQTKIAAERLLVDSGLPRWTWLRLSGVFSPATFAVRDPIVTHTPLDSVLEWVSDADVSRLLVGLTRPDVPEEVWGAVHNVGGGEGWRMTNFAFQARLAGAMGVADIRTWYERRWFATGNFHGLWYADGDALEALVPFRRDTFTDALARAVAGAGAARWAGRVPGWVVRRLVMGPLTRRPRGTMHAVRRADAEAVRAHFGSREAFDAIGDWTSFEPGAPSVEVTRLDHGYDESLPVSAWDADTYAGAAAFRGGVLLTREVVPGDVGRPLLWRCGLGHAFAASPRLVLAAGHWCPACVRDTGGYAQQAALSPFLAQVEPPQP